VWRGGRNPVMASAEEVAFVKNYEQLCATVYETADTNARNSANAALAATLADPQFLVKVKSIFGERVAGALRGGKRELLCVAGSAHKSASSGATATATRDGVWGTQCDVPGAQQRRRNAFKMENRSLFLRHLSGRAGVA